MSGWNQEEAAGESLSNVFNIIRTPYLWEKTMAPRPCHFSGSSYFALITISFTSKNKSDIFYCMSDKRKTKTKFKRIVSEQFPINPKRGGGIVKVDVWENEKGEVVKYSLAYINHLVFSGDNGRVIGYDNTHNFHHKHYLSEISEVDNFRSYQELVGRFENEIKEFIK